MRFFKFFFGFILLFSGFSFATELIPAKVLYVLDGDTIKVFVNGKRESVRLIGIDTPESRINRRAKWQAKDLNKNVYEIVKLGKKAKSFVKTLVKKGDTVYLEFDIQQRDRYRRLLAYVWLQDGRILNREIICNGYAMPLTVPPNVKYADEFLWCYQTAREAKIGLWKEDKKDFSPFTCGTKKYCYQMISCEEAFFYLNTCGLKRLDRDKDGIPCEALCR